MSPISARGHLYVLVTEDLPSRYAPQYERGTQVARINSNGKKKKPRARITAKNADKHVLYQKSVQDPEAELQFLSRVFRARSGRDAESLREDFCGTALLCAEWVKRRANRTATGIDIDASVLAWGSEHNLAPLGESKKRVELRRQDVRDEYPKKHDVVCAFNFSYWIFRTRDDMRGYFKTVRRSLKRDGLFFLDAYGGWEAHEPMLEHRPVKGGFTYIWDQHSINPIDNSVVNYIHFEFRDGSKMKKAFTYEWRFWSLAELRELLQEAGFSEVSVYWDTSEDDDHENYRPRKIAENQPGWLAYLVAAP
jgi:SAM-dependent methyltransferase